MSSQAADRDIAGAPPLLALVLPVRLDRIFRHQQECVVGHILAQSAQARYAQGPQHN